MLRVEGIKYATTKGPPTLERRGPRSMVMVE
jgi:hypothetical protein